MRLKGIREGELKEVFNALESAFTATGTDFYVIGALARDVWYARGDKSFRATKDVDFAVLVGSLEEYNAVRNYLKEHNQFQSSKENAFVMLTPVGIQVDILPFGKIQNDDKMQLTGEGLTSIKINGLNEVYDAGTEEMKLMTGHYFKIATLPSIVLLKLIAFDDRPEHRMKDPGDIANIINYFFDLRADLIYGKHIDLFTGDSDPKTLADISAIVIGREIKEICGTNISLMERLKEILEVHIKQAENSAFIRNMVREVNKNVEECNGWLKHILSSLID